MDSNAKRDSVKKDYDLIAEQYANDFGNYIEDIDVYEKFEEQLPSDATILDLGAGTGRTYSYFNKKGYKYIGLDFSSKMKEYAYKLHGDFPYILDDMVNIRKHFKDNSIDAVFAVYSLFHLPDDDLKKVLSDIYAILKDNGVFLFSYQVGANEEFTDEPYLGDRGHNVLYMNYQTNEKVMDLLSPYKYYDIYDKEKTETVDGAINSNNNITVFKILKKRKGD
jgi:Methylase involved in ubiquinone/menaquinone biosynthesis